MALTTDLVSYYKLDENAASTTVDDAHGSNDGTASTNTNNLYDASGKINSAFDFNGTDEYVTATSGVQTGDWSVTAWFKSSSTAGNCVFMVNGGVGNGIGIMLGGLSEGKIAILQDKVTWGGASTTSYNDGNWHFVVLTKSGTSYNAYVDGGSTAVSSITATVTMGTSFNIGRTNNNDIRYLYWFDGLVDEVGIFDAVLTTTQMSDLYNSGDGFAYPFTTGTNMSINIADVWKDVDSLQINIGDVWKDVVAVQQNVGDAWVDVF